MLLKNKINKSVFLTLGVLLSLSISSCQRTRKDVHKDNSEKAVIDTIAPNDKGEELRDYYNRAQGTDSIKYQRLFLSSFPDNFSLFNSLYGYSEEKGAMPLNDVYENHIKFLCRLNSIGNEEFLNKLVKLGIDGRWDADAVNLLQDCILNHIKENLSLAVTLLQQYKDKEVKKFWFFLFDGPHPEKEIPIDMNRLHKLDSKIAALAEESFKEVHLASESHGN